MTNSGDSKLPRPERRPYVFAVVSGKGGVGKTNTASNLAIMLAASGKRVLVFDADLGLANVDVLLGLSPRQSLQDVLACRGDLHDVLLDGPGGITIVPASSGSASMAALNAEETAWLCQQFKVLMAEYDFAFINAPSGIAFNMQTAAELADEVLLLTTPEPTAVMDAYAVVKLLSAQRPWLPIRLVVNMISDFDAGERISSGFKEVASQFLDRRIETLARLPFDPHVQLAVRRQQPYALCYPHCPATYALRTMSLRLLGHKPAAKTIALASAWPQFLFPGNRLARTAQDWPDPSVG